MRRDSRISQFSKDVMSGLMQSPVNLPEKMTKQASDYKIPERTISRSRFSTGGFEAAFSESEAVRKAFPAVKKAYEEHKYAQIRHIGSEAHGDFGYRVKFSVTDGRKTAEVLALSTPNGVAPVTYVELKEAASTPDIFYVGDTAYGPFEDSAGLKVALANHKIHLSSTKPHCYLLGLLPEDKRDLQAIANTLFTKAKPIKKIAEKVVVDSLAKERSAFNTTLEKSAVAFHESDLDFKAEISSLVRIKKASDKLLDKCAALTGSALRNVKSDYEEFTKIAEDLAVDTLGMLAKLDQKNLSPLEKKSHVVSNLKAALAGGKGDPFVNFQANVVSLNTLIKRSTLALENKKEVSGFSRRAQKFDDEGVIVEGSNELDVANKSERDAVLKAFKTGATVDDVCNQLGLTRLKVTLHLEALRSRGFKVVDDCKDANKKGKIVNPGVDIRGMKIKLVPFTEVKLENGVVKQSQTNSTYINQPHCARCGDTLTIETGEGGEMHAFCSRCRQSTHPGNQKKTSSLRRVLSYFG